MESGEFIFSFQRFSDDISWYLFLNQGYPNLVPVYSLYSICWLDDCTTPLWPSMSKCLFPIVNCTIVIKLDFNNRSVILDILTVMALSWPIPLIEFKTFDFINLIGGGERSCTVTDVMFVIKADHWWWLPWCHQSGLVLLVITD